MELVADYALDLDFWEANPQLSFISPFKELYNKGKARKKTSNIAWGIHHYSNTSDRSLMVRNGLSQEEKAEMASKEFGVDFENDLHLNCIKYYELHLLDAIEKQLIKYEQFLLNRTEWINSQPYNFETMAYLDKAASLSKKIWDDYVKVKKAFEDEKKKQKRTYGNRELSLNEKGVI